MKNDFESKNDNSTRNSSVSQRNGDFSQDKNARLKKNTQNSNGKKRYDFAKKSAENAKKKGVVRYSSISDSQKSFQDKKQSEKEMFIPCETMSDGTVREIEKIVGYTFKDRRLLERAFTHGSKDQSATKNYQSLEFLGDSILDFVIAKRLMEINPDAHEGALTRLRAQIVSKEPLAEEVAKLGLENYLIVGKGENAKAISNGQKTMSDIFEAVIAAIYLDSGSIDSAEKFILSKLADLLNGKGKHVGVDDYKSKLNEFASRNDVAVSYEELKRTGPAHNPTFVVEVKVNTFVAGVGEGKTKREAEQIAAKQALEKIEL